MALLPVNLDFSIPSFENDIEAILAVDLITQEEAQQNLNDAIIAAGGTIPTGLNIPVANAGLDISQTNSNVSLDGSGSYDLDGDSLTYSWSIVSIPNTSTITLSNTSIVNPSFVADALGIYTFSLVVSDGMTVSSSDTVSITITAGSFAPVAQAGSNQNISTSSLVTLDGSSSSDANGDSLFFAWVVLSKPFGSTMVLSDATLVNPSFTADLDGTYSFQLIVNDGVLFSLADTVDVIAITGNSAPVANAGSNQLVATGSVVTLDGSTSSDTDGDGLSYTWSIASKPAATTISLSNAAAVNPYFTAYVDGTYTFNLIVNDGSLNSVVDSVSIVASTANVIPISNAGADQNVATSSLVTLDGSGSTDAEGDSINYTWSITSKPATSTATLSNANTVNPTFTADKDGTYTFQLLVDDGNIEQTSDSVTITSSTANSAPVANAGSDASTYTNQALSLSASASSDANLDPLSYAWSISSKPATSVAASFSNASIVNPTFTADIAGSYVLQLIVNDGFVDSAIDTITITAITAQVVKKTGQTLSYNSNDDGDYEKGTATSYTLASDVVSDAVTGLMWQDDNPNTSNSILGSSAEGYCTSLSLSGYTDWRLPTVYEVLTISDRGRSAPAIDTTYFRSMSQYRYLWTSTMLNGSERRYVDFYYADDDADSNSQGHSVRCVRGTSTSSLVQRDDANNVVIDYESKLVWQDNTNPSKEDWSGAIGYCESLTLDGTSNWRLPNINEILTVVDFYNTNGVYSSVFDYNHDNAWTSTTVPNLTDKAYSIIIPTSFFSFFGSDDKPFVAPNEDKNWNIFADNRKIPKCVKDLP